MSLFVLFFAFAVKAPFRRFISKIFFGLFVFPMFEAGNNNPLFARKLENAEKY